MKWFPRASRMQWYSFLLSMPLIGTALLSVLYGDRIFEDIRVWLLAFPMIWLLGLTTWYLHVRYENWVTSKYPELEQSRRRILQKSLVVLLVMSPAAHCTCHVGHPPRWPLPIMGTASTSTSRSLSADSTLSSLSIAISLKRSDI